MVLDSVVIIGVYLLKNKMIKTNTKKLCKAVEMVREKRKLLNDVVDNELYCENEWQCFEAGVDKNFQGEYSKELARNKEVQDRYETRVWISLGIIAMVVCVSYWIIKIN